MKAISKTVHGIKYPKTLISLREKLGQKAKCEPHFRFYALYGHLMRKDVLQTAWKLTRRNKGAPGIDDLTFKEIEDSKGGVSQYLDAICSSLRDKTYRADPVKRVYIPKANGEKRPLSMITIKDRIVQTALFLLLEPIFETDFLDCSYGFRPNKSAHQAVIELKEQINEGHLEVIDADLKDCFGAIPHDKLMTAIEQRVADGQILKLIRKWLKAPIREPRKAQYKPTRGVQQGGVISPLLANIYLNGFDKIFHSDENPYWKQGAKLIRFADDILVTTPKYTPGLYQFVENILEEKLGLTINREKTRVINLSQKESLDYLGYTFQYISGSRNPNRRYCYYHVSRKSRLRAQKKIKFLLNKLGRFFPSDKLIERINVFLQGWGGYFCLGAPSRNFEKLNSYVRDETRQCLNRKSQRGYKLAGSENWYQCLTRLGLARLNKSRFA